MTVSPSSGEAAGDPLGILAGIEERLVDHVLRERLEEEVAEEEDRARRQEPDEGKDGGEVPSEAARLGIGHLPEFTWPCAILRASPR